MAGNDALQGLQDSIGKLPVLPVVVQEVIACLGDPDVDVGVLGRKIARDPVLGARLLRVANSAFYGLSKQVATPHDAIVVMGLSQVRSLVLAAGLAAALPERPHGFDRRAHWQRSFGVATTAQALARRLRGPADSAFIAGILHNIGELVLDVCLAEAFAAARGKARDEGMPLRDAERQVLGFDHTEVGAEAARQWKLPEAIEHAIRHCHDPAIAATAPVSACVATACLLDGHVRTRGAAGGEPAPLVIPDALREVVPLDDASLLACVPDAGQTETAAALLLGG